MAETWYVVVQHSGYGYVGNPQFMNGLELRTVEKKSDMKKVLNAGGIMFRTYEEADKWAEEEMYPPGYNGMLPRASGYFAREEIDGLRIYVKEV